MSSILPDPLELPYEGVRLEEGFSCEAQMAYFLKDGWTVDSTETFLEKPGTNTIIIQFKYSVLFLVRMRSIYWDKERKFPIGPRYKGEKNIIHPCQTIQYEDQWDALRTKYNNGYTVIWWIQTKATNADGMKQIKVHKRRSIPGVMQHAIGGVPDSCPWHKYNHVFIVATHKDREWMVYDNEPYMKYGYAYEIYVYGLRPMFIEIGKKLETYIEHLDGAKKGKVPDGYTLKKFDYTEIGCREGELCWACENSCVLYAVYAIEFIIIHPERHDQDIMYKVCRNQKTYGLMRAKLDHYSRVKRPKRNQYIDVEEGIWGTDIAFQYQQLLIEVMLDESSLENDLKVLATPDPEMDILNKRLKSMAKKPKRKITNVSIILLQGFIDERKTENIRKLKAHIWD